MRYGVEKTTIVINENLSLTDIKKIKDSEPYATWRQYRIRVSVRNSQEEMAEFIRFTKEIAERKVKAKLICDKHDPSTFPAFIIEYPKNDQGSYFIIKRYTVEI